MLSGIYHLAFPLPIILICSLFIVGGGELYTWGSNENGCLGTGYVPRKIFSLYQKLT